MNKKRVYLAGNIEGLTWENSSRWRTKAVNMLKDAGIEDVYNPCDHIPLEMRNGIITAERIEQGGGFHNREVITQDLFHLQRCNIFLVDLRYAYPGIGTLIEFGIKWTQGAIIVGFGDKNNPALRHPFIRKLCHIIYDTDEQAIDFIINI